MLEANKDWVFVAPGINWLIATLYEAEAFGFPQEAAEAVGYKKELEIATDGLREMHRRGIKLLPGGDYGFAWTPHGTYARDLSTSSSASASRRWRRSSRPPRWGGEIMLRPDELGQGPARLPRRPDPRRRRPAGGHHDPPGPRRPARDHEGRPVPQGGRAAGSPRQRAGRPRRPGREATRPVRRGPSLGGPTDPGRVPLRLPHLPPRRARTSGAFGRPARRRARRRTGRAACAVSGHVPCLGGCPHAGNVALDGIGKARVRFSDLTTDDAGDLVDAAVAYDACSTGTPGDWESRRRWRGG